ncbi:MAG: arginine--tRNA ligase [Candidatus Buchananbacteria bacterium]
MINFRQEVAKLIKVATSFKVETSSLIVPPNPAWGDFGWSVFGLAKEQKIDPAKLAKDLAAKVNLKIKSGSTIKRCQAVGPYLNFFLDQTAVAQEVLGQIAMQGKKYGQQKLAKSKTVMLEYSGPNTHKDFHIGHLRNTVLGAALINLYQAQGLKVISANYINDVGSHVAKVLWYLTKSKIRNEKLIRLEPGTLGQAYARASQLIKEKPEFEGAVSEVKQQLENILPPQKAKTKTEQELFELWKKTKEFSLAEFKKIYSLLGAKFSVYYFEKDLRTKGKAIVEQLLKQKIAVRSQGAVIVDLKSYGLDVLLILRTDGTGLYATSDLALAQEKFKKAKLAASIYVTDSRQSFYFKQLFKILELQGFKGKLIHVPYEFVTLGGKVLASREGVTMTFWSVYEEAVKLAVAETTKRHTEWSAKKIAQTAQTLALATLKFEMLKTSAQNKIDFVLEQAIRFEGFTGPYLLYTLARINSIFSKGKVKTIKHFVADKLNSEIEKKIISQLAQFSPVVAKAQQTHNPALLAQYLFELARNFASFYESQPVLQAEIEIKNSRLYLLQNIRQVMENGLALLGIETLKEM